jgi:type VI secretion system protein ImpN
MTNQELARQYAALWAVLNQDGGRQRDDREIHLLVNRVRDALDRHLEQISQSEPQFIANSFAIEETIYRSEHVEVIGLRHRDLGICFAMKTLPLLCANDVVAKDMLLREARVGMSVMHPNVIRTHMVLRLPDGRPALIIDRMRESLSDRLEAAPLSASNTVDLMRGLLTGLGAVHAAGIVHCDIAPGNILFECDGFGNAKLADFGIALPKGESHRNFDIQLAGNTDFAAPEQLAGGKLDERSDLYACGRLMEQLLYRCTDTPAAAALKKVSERLLDKDQEKRPATAGQVVQMLPHSA